MSEKKLLAALAGDVQSPPPLWLMRQAGRYLPEYRAVRAGAGSFLDLCYSAKLAAEVTVQPLRRFDFDAAIVFADILLVPHALGQPLEFRENEGPYLEPVTSLADVDAMREVFAGGRLGAGLDAVSETLSLVKRELSASQALIGFCGAPWTVATYMVQGTSKPEQAPARQIAYEADWFSPLMDLLVEVSADYLCDQIEAGADVVQIFDTWSGVLSNAEFERWVEAPTRALVDRVRARHGTVPIIGFPRGAGASYPRYAKSTGVDTLGIDHTMELAWVAGQVDDRFALQGNLDPIALRAGGEVLDRAVDEILSVMRGRAHVFNLGHGILPDTPVEHVERLVARVRAGH